MSRLRRPFVFDRYLFVTVRLLPTRCALEERDYACLATALTAMRWKQGFTLTAWVFLPDHWHAIIYPPHPLTIGQTMSAIKVSSTVAINHARHAQGGLWQERFFDHALRTVKDYQETVEYVHFNPVRRGLVKRPEEWKWSSFLEYAGAGGGEHERRCGLRIDRVRLPADENTRI